MTAKLLRRQLQRMLRPGTEVLVAHDGSQAVDCVRRRLAGHVQDAGAAIALVVMDMEMPGMGGLEATRRIRGEVASAPALARSRQPRIVILTGNATVEDRDRALAAGADGFEGKPCSKDWLAAQVEAAATEAFQL